ncbi:TRM11 family SAM-dependent methyltransferase [Thermogemmatispora sp.]|uniref:TRM11 family SAM-dependent methyltransferase n=1 Tax=Thermogemmatispora sp. TaxID=1968838 RepID=UPI001D63C9E8|nr:hypothetical protein [Thermogemmatispora sp.]MBX5451257.1 hypothetical protein [Thermogemmatispora sp.]
MKLALKIKPQRSNQYTNMVETLAEPELRVSPLGPAISELQRAVLGGQSYLLVSIEEGQIEREEGLRLLAHLGTISEVYEYFAEVGGVEGPFLRPLALPWQPFISPEIAEVRRYKGKTNEIFTRVLLNVAIFSSAYATSRERLRILDPLAGGGTTLFVALAAGYDAIGIEQKRQDVETTAVFLRQYLSSEGITFKEVCERRRSGKRYQFEIRPGGKNGEARLLALIHGDSREAPLHLRELPGGTRVHAVVGDLPYGIQHGGEIEELLRKALPAWGDLLLPGGTLALAWNATRLTRAAMCAIVERYSGLQIRNDPPYTQFAHTVDRVIKKRDLLVAVKS